MMPIINLFHHFVGNLFNFGVLVCLFLLVVTTINAIFLLVGRHPAFRHDWRHRRQFATTLKRHHLRETKNAFKYLEKAKEQPLSN